MKSGSTRKPEIRFMKTRRTFLQVITLALTSWALWTGQSLAAKPPSGGTGGGTIYFFHQNGLSAMNSDGSGKAALAAGVFGEPSRALHGGHRWFLRLQTIAGETYPDGSQRFELFAVRDDAGLTVQLTDQPDLESFGSAAGFVRWGINDAEVSWIAGRWVSGTLTTGGIYAAAVLFDGSGNVAGLAAQPVDPFVPAQIVNDQNEGLRPDIRSHDWSPDGTKVLFDSMVADDGSPRRLFIANASTGQTTILATSTSAAWPVWSPDNTKIAYQKWVFGGGIFTINVDGTNERTIVSRTPKASFLVPKWSPAGSHLIYDSFDYDAALGNGREDIYRAKADGSQKTNLTRDLDTAASGARSVSWR